MRGERQLGELIKVLEEIAAAVSHDRASEKRLTELARRYHDADQAMRAVEAERGWSQEEREALGPLLEQARRMNAIATADARDRQARIGAELEKTRRAIEMLRSRKTGQTGRSCNLTG